MTNGISLLAIAAMSGVGFVVASTADELAVGNAAAAASATCRVTASTRRPVPGRPSFNVGNRHLAVALPTTFSAIRDGSPGGANAFLQKDGWIRTKLGWFSDRGVPRVTGRRVDGAARPLRADVGPLSWASSGSFYPSLLYFSSFGCWKITATAGDARIDAVVRVVRK